MIDSLDPRLVEVILKAVAGHLGVTQPRVSVSRIRKRLRQPPAKTGDKAVDDAAELAYLRGRVQDLEASIDAINTMHDYNQIVALSLTLE